MSVRPEGGRAEDLSARATVTNDESREVVLDLVPLGVPALALEIVDAAGAPVLLPPPPVPGGEARRSRLGPGESRTVEYHGFVPAWTAPGRYRLRLRYRYRPATPAPEEWTGELASGWVEFEIRG